MKIFKPVENNRQTNNRLSNIQTEYADDLAEKLGIEPRYTTEIKFTGEDLTHAQIENQNRFIREYFAEVKDFALDTKDEYIKQFYETKLKTK